MSRLEQTTHVCLILASLVAAGLLLERRFWPHGSAPASSALVGKHLDTPGPNWKSVDINAVLFISTNCHFCLESMPFYRRLAAVRHGEGRVALSVLSLESPDDVRALLAAESISADGVYRSSGAPGLRATPTLLIVDANGIIRRAYVGKLGLAQESEFLRILATGNI